MCNNHWRNKREWDGNRGKRTEVGRPNGTGKFGEPTKPIRVPISDLERAIRCVQNRFFRPPLYHCLVRAGQPAEVESGLRTRDSSDRFFHKDFVVKYLRPILAHSVRITAHPHSEPPPTSSVVVNWAPLPPLGPDTAFVSIARCLS